MDEVIDLFDSISGWTASAGITMSVNEHLDLIASEQDASLMVQVNSGSSGKTIKKILSTPIDCSKFSEIIFNFKSFRLGNNDFTTQADACYSVSFGDGVPYYFPCYSDLCPVSIPARMSQITYVEFTVLTGYADFFVISDLRGCKDELPIDLLSAVRTAIIKERTRLIGNGLAIGVTTAAKGDKTIEILNNWDYLDKDVVIMINDGTNSEIHQIASYNAGILTFSDMYDGQAMVNGFTSGQVYIYFPVEIGRYDAEIRLPGIMLWYTSPSPDPLTSKISHEVKCASDSALYVVRDGLRYKWSIIIDCEGRSASLVGIMTQICRAFIAKSKVWMCGIKYIFDWTIESVDTEPIDSYDIVPKEVYTVSITIRESVFESQMLPKALAATTSFTPQNGG